MKKDWKGILYTKEISLVLIFFPVIFTIVIPIMMMLGVLFAPLEFTQAFGDVNLLKVVLGIPAGYNIYLTGAVIMTKLMILPMFLFVPGMMSSIISSDSFAGEKERKTMENIALLPISKTELIVGKVLASFIPIFIITVSCFIGMGLIINIVFLQHLEGNILIFTDLGDVLVGFILGPLLGFFNVQISVIISSRSKDLKSAQGISGALITPILAVLFVQM
ncbi:MAG: ABC transporter permease subunit, partial [archaeon]|nr:ABC transporter permease subunit [archaeon]